MSETLSMLDMQKEWDDFHIKNRLREFERLDERLKEGMLYVEVRIEQYQMLISENIDLHRRLKRIEHHLGVMAMAAMPAAWTVPTITKDKA